MVNLPIPPAALVVCSARCDDASRPTDASADGRMPYGRATPAPRGYRQMCARDRAACSALSGESSQGERAQAAAHASAIEQRSELERVNRRVNQAIDQLPDLVTVGVQDVWRRPGRDFGAAGDCEDLAIEKRMELLADGFPAEALYYAVGYRRDLGLHAVLVASTVAGDVVLDSRSPYIVPWRRAPYTWVMRQRSGAPDAWGRVEPDAEPTSIRGERRASGAPGGMEGDDSSPSSAGGRRRADLDRNIP